MKWYVVEDYGTPDELRHGPFKTKEEAQHWGCWHGRDGWKVIYYQ